MSRSWSRSVVVAVAGYAVAGGVEPLVGWALDVQRLTDWKGDGISMFPNTAACAVVNGSGRGPSRGLGGAVAMTSQSVRRTARTSASRFRHSKTAAHAGR